MPSRLLTCAAVISAAGTVAFMSSMSSTPASASQHHNDGTTHGYTAAVILSGSSLSHDVNGTAQPLTKPDDIVTLAGKLFVAFQNGVGPQGETSSSGATSSTLVELTRDGDVIRQWDLTGKIDGLGADRATGRIAATVNEDGNSSLYMVNPSATSSSQLTHYLYSQNPLPHGGGTDAVTFIDGEMLVSASAPSSSTGPAVYSVTLQPPTSPGGTGVANTSTLFSDDAIATPANPGAPSQLALTDPDSNTAVPSSAPRFAGDFMLDSQGDQQQVYASAPGTAHQELSVLQLSQSVNDTSFMTSEDGLLFVTDASNNAVDAVTGPFQVGDALVAATPCGSNSAPSTCPAPGFPANYLGTLDLYTGSVSQVQVAGASLVPQGTVFVAGGDEQQRVDNGDNARSVRESDDESVAQH
ncbi:MAG TPA: hypothetical protein VMO88_14225 [Acidimicrobiales bacterium]|nr:hypothetical protein [Acidimicrobiales bacterium]